jgi:hypothetical protein
MAVPVVGVRQAQQPLGNKLPAEKVTSRRCSVASVHLFITAPGEAEYLYNNVVEVEPGRFVSGHKTLLLTVRTADPGRKLLVLHVHELDIRVTRFFCR